MAYGYPGMKSPEQFAQEYNSALTAYQNLYKNLNYMNPYAQMPGQMAAPQSQVNNPVGNSVSTQGDYKIVSKYEEVANTPTRLDGTASLFFDFDHMIFWSKKFVNGQHSIQAYGFSPINNSSEPGQPTSQSKSENATVSEPQENDVVKIILDRLDKLEAAMQKQNKMDEPVTTNTLPSEPIRVRKRNDNSEVAQ